MTSLLAALLSGCFGSGHSADPPSGFTAVAGDGRVKLDWTASPGVDYWVFSATDPSLTAFNWTGLSNARGYKSAVAPFYACGLFNGTGYYFAANGRVDGGPGGTSTPTVNALPYNVSTTWASGVPSTASDLLGVGYAGLTTCSNSTVSAAGSFAAVGAAGAIFTSPDGINWVNRSTPVATNLNAVTGYAANQNNSANPGLRWIAVGDGGTSVYSTDGITWLKGTTTTTTNALHSVTHSAGTFFAVGDTGTIISSSDGNTWTSHTANSGTSNNLYGVTHGNNYVAVGDAGTIVTSGDGGGWTLQPYVTANTLRQVTTVGSIIVAVGDAGTIVTSKNGGSSWALQAVPSGSPNLVGVTSELRYEANALTDPELGFISTVQFVAVDDTGNAYTSVNGYTWSTAIPTGATGLNALVSSGFGYVAAGNGGATAYAF